jgi:hypothetical protein
MLVSEVSATVSSPLAPEAGCARVGDSDRERLSIGAGLRLQASDARRAHPLDPRLKIHRAPAAERGVEVINDVPCAGSSIRSPSADYDGSPRISADAMGRYRSGLPNAHFASNQGKCGEDAYEKPG